MLELNSKTLKEQLEGELPVVVDFWAAWCMPCKIFAPVLEELADQLDGRVIFAKVNVDDNNDLAVQYGIASIPTLIIFKEGAPVETLVGVLPKDKLQEAVEKYI